MESRSRGRQGRAAGWAANEGHPRERRWRVGRVSGSEEVRGGNGAAPGLHAPGLYVHVPFCSRICPYCDFAVTPLGRPGGPAFERYRRALLREVERRALPLGADTAYFGGGTPSLAPAGFFAEIVSALEASGLVAPSPFVVVEANPEDLARNRGLARQWAREGVSGVSLGAQSLDDRRLRFLGRAHTGAEVRTAVSRLAEAAIPWVSLDLIYGTAGQAMEALRAELVEAASLPGLTHISAYELTVEPATPFGRRAAAGERLGARAGEGAGLFRTVHQTLASRGFPAYEASNFAAAPEHRSRHNRKYWSGARYLGLGPSAHSFAPGRGERSWNHRSPGAWQAALDRGESPTAGRETLAPADRALEELFLRLRTTAGLDLDGFASRYGEAVVAANRTLFAGWEARGLVRREVRRELPGERTGRPARLAPTLSGLALADALAREVDLAAVPRRTAA